MAKARISKIAIWLVVVFPLVCANSNVTSAQRLTVALLVEATSSIVRIEANRPGTGIQVGTGVVLSEGEIVTACHVVRDAGAVIVIHAGRRYVASQLRALPARDVCAFSVPGLEAPIAKVRPAVELQIGEPVAALGFGGGAGMKWKAGSVVRKHPFDGGIIVQTTTPFNSGASGGPLLDDAGNVVGLLSFRTRGTDPSFYAIPVDWAIDAIEPGMSRGQADSRSSALPFWDGVADELPFFMQASLLKAEQRWDELRLLCEVWQLAEPGSGEPAFVESHIDTHYEHHEAAHEQLVYATGLDTQHVHAWAALVRVRVFLKDEPGARAAFDRLQLLNEHLANQLIDEGIIAER